MHPGEPVRHAKYVSRLSGGPEINNRDVWVYRDSLLVPILKVDLSLALKPLGVVPSLPHAVLRAVLGVPSALVGDDVFRVVGIDLHPGNLVERNAIDGFILLVYRGEHVALDKPAPLEFRLGAFRENCLLVRRLNEELSKCGRPTRSVRFLGSVDEHASTKCPACVDVHGPLEQRPGGHTGGKFRRDHLDFFEIQPLQVVTRDPIPD